MKHTKITFVLVLTHVRREKW